MDIALCPLITNNFAKLHRSMSLPGLVHGATTIPERDKNKKREVETYGLVPQRYSI